MEIRTPPPHVLANLPRLRAYANGLAAFYGHPVHLVGSALAACNEQPRDWDVRITIPDEEFERRYGHYADWVKEAALGTYTRVRWSWAEDCKKKTQDGWRDTGLYIDFQVYCEMHVLAHSYNRRPRFRLDTLPDPPREE